MQTNKQTNKLLFINADIKKKYKTHNPSELILNLFQRETQQECPALLDGREERSKTAEPRSAQRTEASSVYTGKRNPDKFRSGST